MTQTGFPQSIVLLFLFAFLGVQLIGWTGRDTKVRKTELRIFLIGLALRYAVSLVIYEFGFVEVIKDEDAYDWLGGVDLYRDWTFRGLSPFDLPAEFAFPFLHPLGNYGFMYLAGSIFYFTDMPARLPAAVLNNFFGAITAVISYRVAALVFSEWVAVRVGWATCLMPSLIIWGAQTLKEPVVILLEVVALYACIQLKTQRAFAFPVVMCSVAIFWLIPFRFYAMYITAGAVVASLLMPRIGGNRGPRSAFSGVAVAALILALVASAGVLGSHMPLFEKYDLRTLQDIRDWTAQNTGSGVPMAYDLQKPSGFLMSVLVGGAHVLFAPFPWQLGGASLRMLFATPDAAIWWWLAFQGLVPGLLYSLRRRFNEVQPILLFLLPMLVLYSITFSNVGLGYRYRAQLLPFLMMFVMAGLEQRKIRRMATLQAKEAYRVALRRRGAERAALLQGAVR